MITIISLLMIVGLVYARLTLFDTKNVLACGLFGYSGARLPDISKLKLLCLDAEERGWDSTGLYTIENGRWVTSKRATKAIYEDEFDEYASGKVVIGHSRRATMGGTGLDNAHPFVYEVPDVGKIAGAHNGWLIEPERQAEKLGVEWPGLDSKLIFEYFISTDLSFPSIHSKIYGAMALSFCINSRVYLYRRKSKPLYIAEDEHGGLWWCSRKEGLDLAGLKDGISLPTNVFVGIEEGKMVDHRYFGADPYPMEEDSSPSMWRSHNYKVAAEIEEYLGVKRSNQIGFRRKETKADIINDNFNKFIEKFNSKALDSNDYNVIDDFAVKECIKEDKKCLPNNSYLLCSMNNGTSLQFGDEYYAFLDIAKEETIVKFNKGGYCSIKIPDKFFDKKGRLVIVDGKSLLGLYTNAFVIPKSSVLEVALGDISFPEVKKKEEGCCGDNHQMQLFRNDHRVGATCGREYVKAPMGGSHSGDEKQEKYNRRRESAKELVAELLGWHKYSIPNYSDSLDLGENTVSLVGLDKKSVEILYDYTEDYFVNGWGFRQIYSSITELVDEIRTHNTVEGVSVDDAHVLYLSKVKEALVEFLDTTQTIYNRLYESEFPDEYAYEIVGRAPNSDLEVVMDYTLNSLATFLAKDEYMLQDVATEYSIPLSDYSLDTEDGLPFGHELDDAHEQELNDAITKSIENKIIPISKYNNLGDYPVLSVGKSYYILYPQKGDDATRNFTDFIKRVCQLEGLAYDFWSSDLCGISALSDYEFARTYKSNADILSSIEKILSMLNGFLSLEFSSGVTHTDHLWMFDYRNDIAEAVSSVRSIKEDLESFCAVVDSDIELSGGMYAVDKVSLNNDLFGAIGDIHSIASNIQHKCFDNLDKSNFIEK